MEGKSFTIELREGKSLTVELMEGYVIYWKNLSDAYALTDWFDTTVDINRKHRVEAYPNDYLEKEIHLTSCKGCGGPRQR